jgi:hypothetical protein
MQRGTNNRRMEDQASPGTKQYCISKITNAKRDSGVAHFIE